MVGHGETTEIAIENLKKKFKLYKDNNKDLPSPGTKVPLRFESTDNIDQFKDIAVDFFKTVLSMDYNEGFYSDGSNLSLLEPLDEEQAKNARGQIIRRTIMRYGIDISSIYDGPLYAIFKAIRDKYK
jgi:hypothetical protein